MKRKDREEKLQQVDEVYNELYRVGPQAQSQPFDPADEVRKRLAREKQRAEVESEYAKLNPPKLDPPFDPLGVAKKRLEREKQRELVDIEYEKLNPTIPVLEPAFDPLEVAKKRVEREEQLAAADAEYKKLVPPEVIPVFDPKYQAKKRFEKNQEKLSVEEEYQKRYGVEEVEEPKKPTDLLDVFNSLRGTIGGKFGQAAGSGADLISALQKGGSEGGGIGGLADGAGPIGAVVAAAMATDKAIKDGIKSTIAAVGSGVSEAMTANGSVMKPVSAFGDAVSKAGEHMGPFSYGVIAAGEGLKALSAITDGINETVKQYGDYSAPLAQSVAAADVRSTLGDLRRAQESGPELARYVRAQSDLQQKYEDVKVRLMEILVPRVTNILEKLEVIMTVIDNAARGQQIVGKVLSDGVDALRRIAHLKEEELHPPPNDPTDHLLRGDVEVPER